jgi:GR25 family glycosyltransferase involved in LPS biosynthesis
MLNLSLIERFDLHVPFYYINLDRRPDRKKQFLRWFDNSHISPIRTPAFDGQSSDFFEIIHGPIPEDKRHLPSPQLQLADRARLDIIKSQLGCTCSHLRSIETWLKSSESVYGVFSEDDLSFSTLKYWNFNLSDIISAVPNDWDCIQLTSNSAEQINHLNCLRFLKGDGTKTDLFKIKPWVEGFWSTACYVVKRSYGQFLINKMKVGDRYSFATLGYNQYHADICLYNQGNTYSVNLLTNIICSSDIVQQSNCYYELIASKNWWWANFGNKMPLSEFLS